MLTPAKGQRGGGEGWQVLSNDTPAKGGGRVLVDGFGAKTWSSSGNSFRGTRLQYIVNVLGFASHILSLSHIFLIPFPQLFKKCKKHS